MKLAEFDKDDPQFQALCDIMRIAELDEQKLLAALFAIAFEHGGSDSPATSYIAGGGKSFPEIADRLDWTNERLLRELTTHLCETYIDGKLRDAPPPRERMN